ncbi:hypothetical protein VTK56DRAFT_1687 [Thermocarpiscus australiensis]
MPFYNWKPTAEDPRIGPAVAGVIYDKRPGDLSDEERDLLETTGPLLNVIWLPLKPGTVLEDETETQPLARIWQAALDYIAIFRGCDRIYWGTALEAIEDGPAVVLLTEWRDGIAWQAFQQSPALEPIARFTREHPRPLNHTVRVDQESISGLEFQHRIAEIMFLAIPSDSEKSPTEEALSRLHELAKRGARVQTYSRMTERYTALFADSGPGKQRAQLLPDILASIATWCPSEYYAVIGNQAMREAASRIASNVLDFHRLTARLQAFTIVASHPVFASASPSTVAHSTADFFAMPPVPRLGRFPRGLGQDPFLRQSQVAEKNELYEADPNRIPLPNQPRGPDKMLVLDTFRISFTPEPDCATVEGDFILPADLKERLGLLRGELAALPGCKAVLYARLVSFQPPDVGSYQRLEPRLASYVDKTAPVAFLLLVFWDSDAPELTATRKATGQRVIKTIEAVGSVREPVRRDGEFWTKYPFAEGRNPPQPIYELVSFYIPVQHKALFDAVYGSHYPIFPRIPNKVGDHRPPPVEDLRGVWATDGLAVRPDGRQMARFTAVRAWHAAGSAKAWYEKVSHDVWRDSCYEGSGMKIDALRAVAEGGAESTFLAVVGLAEKPRRFVFPAMSPED